MKHKWEMVNNCLRRMETPTGWIVLHDNTSHSEDDSAHNISESMCFVPDPEKKWILQ